MPRTKKFLPHPCPICERQNGTIRIQIFPKGKTNLVCKIGHYIPIEYKNPTPISIPQNSEDSIKKFKTKRAQNRGKVWHGFQIEPNFAGKYSEKFSDMLDAFIKKSEKNNYKIIDFKPPSSFEELIKKTGWCMKPYQNYHGRKRRHSKYHFPKEEY